MTRRRHAVLQPLLSLMLAASAATAGPVAAQPAQPAVATANPPAPLAPPATLLADYLGALDDSHAWTLVETRRLAGADAHIVRMTSQTWRGRPWEHWLAVVVPDERTHDDACVLLIEGGRNGDAMPNTDNPLAAAIASLATQTGTPLAVLLNVPNQPLYDGRYEDALIAHTFRRFLDTGDPTWPLLLPMTKAAVRGLDTAAAVLAQTDGLAIERFVVTGASKRGWTSYLTAAHDERVVGVAPLVFDMLDFHAQTALQQRGYGGPSSMIHDYADAGVLDRFGTEQGDALRAAVDPFAVRDRLTMPKLLGLGTNDPYWSVDSSSVYVDELPGPTAIHYVHNAGHTLGTSVFPAIAAFVRATLAGEALPGVAFAFVDDTLRVTPGGDPARVEVWRASAPTRDFRDARWRPRPVRGADDAVSVNAPAPDGQWHAAYVQVHHRVPGGVGFALSSPIIVWSPDGTRDAPTPAPGSRP